MKTSNQKLGALKRKMKLSGDIQPGDLISKVNESKSAIKNKDKKQFSKTRLAIMGLV
jgi:hypothetical protein